VDYVRDEGLCRVTRHAGIGMFNERSWHWDWGRWVAFPRCPQGSWIISPSRRIGILCHLSEGALIWVSFRPARSVLCSRVARLSPCASGTMFRSISIFSRRNF
jgi:hypothetical protein